MSSERCCYCADRIQCRVGEQQQKCVSKVVVVIGREGEEETVEEEERTLKLPAITLLPMLMTLRLEDVACCFAIAAAAAAAVVFAVDRNGSADQWHEDPA
jgi:hypothetical protein